MVFDKNKKIEEKIELINARIRDFPEFVDELEVYTRTLDVENLESHDINDVDDLIAERSQGLATKCVATWLEAESRIAENNAPETARVHRKKK